MEKDKDAKLVERAIQRSIELGHIVRLPSGAYQLTEAGRAHVELFREDTMQ